MTSKMDTNKIEIPINYHIRAAIQLFDDPAELGKYMTTMLPEIQTHEERKLDKIVEKFNIYIGCLREMMETNKKLDNIIAAMKCKEATWITENHQNIIQTSMTLSWLINQEINTLNSGVSQLSLDFMIQENKYHKPYLIYKKLKQTIDNLDMT